MWHGRFGQLYFDTITHDMAALRYLAQRVGRDHVLLGTDLPFDMALQEPDVVLAEAFDEPVRSRSARPTRPGCSAWTACAGRRGEPGGHPRPVSRRRCRVAGQMPRCVSRTAAVRSSSLAVPCQTTRPLDRM